MSLSYAATDRPRPRTMREWAENLNKPTPSRDVPGLILSAIAVLMAVVVDLLGLLFCLVLWADGETLALRNQALLITGASVCALCAFFSHGSIRRRNYMLIVCACTALLTGTAGWVIHEYFVPEGPGWFGTYGKPMTLWVPSVVVMLASVVAALVSRLMYLKRPRADG